MSQPKTKRNNFIIREIQKNPKLSKQKIANRVEARFGEKITRQRVEQIWYVYFGRYAIKQNEKKSK